MQYITLENINPIVKKMPEILKQEIKVFFMNYNDPIYVTLKKFDIMILLESQANIVKILAKLKNMSKIWC